MFHSQDFMTAIQYERATFVLYDEDRGWYQASTHTHCDCGNPDIETYTLFDGEDHEEFDIEDILSIEAEGEANLSEYYVLVASTGTDPAGLFLVEDKVTKEYDIQLFLNLYVGSDKFGVQVTTVRFHKFRSPRHTTVTCNPDDPCIPDPLRKYLCLTSRGNRWILEGIQLKDIESDPDWTLVPSQHGKRYAQGRVSLEFPRPKADIARELRKLGRVGIK